MGGVDLKIIKSPSIPLLRRGRISAKSTPYEKLNMNPIYIKVSYNHPKNNPPPN